MLPAVTSNVVYTPPQQAPLVNTVILGSEVTRVPSDNVPPSVSNAQVDNNARGNGTFAAGIPPPDTPETSADIVFNPAPGGRPAPTVNLPTAFLAQLLGQSLPAEIGGSTQTLLIEYEKLIALSNVKYKPSNAFKPPPLPASIFGAILQQEQATPSREPVQVRPAVQAPIPAAAQAASEALPATPPLVAPAPPSRSNARPNNNS